MSPIFQVRPLHWSAPEPDGFDAVLMTSAQAAVQGGRALDLYLGLPCYCVGDATAAAARAAGFSWVITGPADGAALLDVMAADGIRSALHLCGREHLALSHPDLQLERRIVYASEPIDRLSEEAVQVLSRGATVLLHSPRAGEHFAALADRAGVDRRAIVIAAISGAAAAAAGTGWRAVASADQPRDEALLELAAKLCKNAGESGLGQAE